MIKRPAVPGYVVKAVTEATDLQALHDAASRHLDDIGFSRFAFHLVRAADYNDRVLTILTDYPDELEGIGQARANSTMVRLPFMLEVGLDAYMIAVGDAAELPVPARSLVVVDPAARPVLGDLAANAATWSPVLLILRRDENGGFDRGGPAQPVRAFHKAVAVFSQSHFSMGD